MITSVDVDRFEVLSNPNADPQSAYRQERKIIYVDGSTVFEVSAKEDVRRGRGVPASEATSTGAALRPMANAVLAFWLELDFLGPSCQVAGIVGILVTAQAGRPCRQFGPWIHRKRV